MPQPPGHNQALNTLSCILSFACPLHKAHPFLPPPLAQAVMHVVDYLMVPSAPGIRELLPNAELKAAVGR